MEIIDMVAVLGAFISLSSAVASYLTLKKRLGIEKDLEREIKLRLIKQKILLAHLENANNKYEVRFAIESHIKDYEDLIFEAMRTLPPEKKLRIQPAIAQQSQKGKVSYISKLLSESLTSA
jgi:hypothetical protein